MSLAYQLKGFAKKGIEKIPEKYRNKAYSALKRLANPSRKVRSVVAALSVAIVTYLLAKDVSDFFETKNPDEIAEFALTLWVLMQVLQYIQIHAKKKKAKGGESYLHNEVQDFLTSLRGMFWEFRILYSVAIFYFCVTGVNDLDEGFIDFLADEKLLPIAGIALAPLITWVTLSIRKDIEIAKLREAWGGEMRSLIANYLSCCREYMHEIGLAKGRLYNLNEIRGKAKRDGDVDKELEVNEAAYEVFSKKLSLEKSVAECRYKLELTLKNDPGEAEGEILEKSRRIEEMMNSLQKAVMRSLRLEINGHKPSLTRKYIALASERTNRMTGELAYFSNNYFSGEWSRIKGFDENIKKTVISITVLMLTVVVCCLIIYMRSSSYFSGSV